MLLNNLALKLNSGLIQMNINNGIVLLFISGLSVLLLAAPAASGDVPNMPMLLYGDIQVNGQSVPVGTIIAAYVGDIDDDFGYITVEEAGQYGDKTNRFVVTEPSGTDDNVIHIFIQTPSMSEAVEAEQTIEWDNTETKRLDLTAVYTEGTNSGKILSSGGGRSTSTVVDPTETAVAGGIGAEETDSTIKATGTTTPDAESPKSTGTSSLLITIALIAIVAIVVFVAYKKFK